MIVAPDGSNITFWVLLSLPRLTNNENTPDAVFTDPISHLMLSAEPLFNAPFDISEPPVSAPTGVVLFMITPSDNVSSTNAFWFTIALSVSVITNGAFGVPISDAAIVSILPAE